MMDRYHDERADEYAALQAENERLRNDLSEVEDKLLKAETEHDAERAKVVQAIAEIRELSADVLKAEAGRDAWRNAAPLCEAHEPTGGTRSGCLLCALEAQSAALSKIDYLCGEPNDMEVSGYDVHCNEEAVVEHVQALRAEREGLVASVSRDLPAGWDGEDAEPVSADTFRRAESLAADIRQAPHIGPCADGTVDIHWRGKSWSVLINVPAAGDVDVSVLPKETP